METTGPPPGGPFSTSCRVLPHSLARGACLIPIQGEPDGSLMSIHVCQATRTVSEDEPVPSGLLRWWLIRHGDCMSPIAPYCILRTLG